MTSLSFEALTPTAFLRRSAVVHAERIAVVDGDRRWTYDEFHERARRLAGALDVAPGTRVAVLCPNTHLLLEAHYGVPLAGAVLVSLNIRLNAAELGYILEHAEAEILLYDSSLKELARQTADAAGDVGRALRMIEGARDYERMLSDARPHQAECADERGLITLNYTSGTTGRPKGVMCHHRGAYLQALSMALHSRMTADDAYLWTLPMFHCNGWCFTWAVTAVGATHVCLPKLDPAEVWRLVHTEGVTHLCAAPTVLTSLVHHADAVALAGQRVWVGTGGAPPSPTLLDRAAALGFDVTHLYGLTETFGPSAINDWRSEWNARPAEEQARLKARQGVGSVVAVPLRVIDAEGEDVPADGQSIGEVAIRGNTVMSGYYRDPEATTAAAPDGWFRTGDLGVMHPDGYVELRDRAKDVIISGGENISSVEVEAAISSHPAVLEVAVIAVPDERWGERPRAYVTLMDGASADAGEIRAHARERLPSFKVPDSVIFGPLPKTGTGKIQKFVLRRDAWGGHAKRIA